MKYHNDLTTHYAGLDLISPIIVASSGLTHRVENMLKYEAAGAGAVVIKSIFEEQMEQEVSFMASDSDYPEAMDYLSHYVSQNEMDKHLELIRHSSEALSIPVIASINCYRKDSWLEYAHKFVDAGASALELNVMKLDADATLDPGTSETKLFNLIKEVKKEIKVPVMVKISKYFADICALARGLNIAGAEGVVLFNRLYTYDIDVEGERLVSGDVFSHPTDLSEPLRFTALVHGQVPDLSIGISSGVRTGNDVVKGLLVGADAIQLCTAIYREGADVITKCLTELDEWMSAKKYLKLSDFKGRLAAKDVEHLNMYLRSQFMKYYSSGDHTPVKSSLPPKIHPDPDYQLEQ